MFFVTALKILLIGTLSIMVVGVCFGIGAFKGILSSAPDVDPATVLPRDSRQWSTTPRATS